MKSILLRNFSLFSLLLAPLLHGQSKDAAGPLQANPANIAPTIATLSHDNVQVVGQPRMTKGHPCTLWDQQDIDHYKEMLKSSKELQVQFEALKTEMDEVIASPVNLPAPPETKTYPGDYFPPFPGFPDDPPIVRFRRHIQRDAQNAASLGTLYALTGEEKYGEYAKQLILAYAHASQYTAHPALNYRNCAGMISQLLEEALILNYFSFGYDLVYNLPSWKPDERTRVHDELLRPYVMEFLHPAAPELERDPTIDTRCDMGVTFASQANNRGLIASNSVLWAGYATDDQELIDAALYGVHPTIENSDSAHNKTFPPVKDWTVCTAEKPGRGLLTTFFSTRCIPGGMWVEGSPGYSLYALGSMVDAAEITWHHGIDLYRHNGSIFKYMFDYPILMAYPDMSLPAENDSHRESMLVIEYPGLLNKFGAPAPNLYEYAYRRYNDPAYLPIINNAGERAYLANPPPQPAASPAAAPSGSPAAAAPPISFRHLNMAMIGAVPPSLLYDLDPSLEKAPVPAPSVNYPLVGFGILRTPPVKEGSQQQSLILSYGPTASHGHPDKLHLDLYALNDVLMPSPGISFPYTNPLIPKWYHTTLAHNTLTVDEKSQDYLGGNRKSMARSDQTVFAPASTVALQRAWTESVYSGVNMDRAVFMTPGYLADLFGASSAEPHKYDLAWHIRGEVTSDLKFDPMTFDQAVDGYNALTNVRQAAVGDQPWLMDFTRGNHVARLHGAGGPSTRVIVGDGGTYNDTTDKTVRGKPTAPTIIERRENIASTIYGNALDFSGGTEGYVKGVTQEGDLAAGYGLLKVNTTEGTDLCFASYRPGTYKAAGLETDALQALVLMKGKDVRTLYLAGGKSLKAAGASISRSEPGLAYVEKMPGGSYIIANPSPTDATVTVTLPAIAGMKAFHLDGANQRAGDAGEVNGGTFGATFKAGSKVELTPNP